MTDQPVYQALARKHRPQDFAALIGQEAMVRVLRNAFASDRIHHAFVLTGVRGVGKTTTARIIAKGLNCEGVDGSGGPTVAPCGVCEPCRRIAEGRYIDVLEIDAASNTGVDFVRDVTEMARTAPSGRFRVFILDEVHMLSTSAFNALLKTLEEPPPHVKFIFATTEIRKVPATILSRCQRFDLRRIEPEVMMGYLRGVAEAEGAAIANDALALITRAAGGSVRDALSLMDQALTPGGPETSAAEVRAMLGLADRGRVLDLFEAIMRGDAAGALAELGAQYADGADPEAVLRDLAEVTHWLSVVKVAPDAADDPAAAAAERERGRALAERLGMRSLARAWQMLLKALEEVAVAPNVMMAAEMAVIRLTHVADLPSPEDLVRRLSAGGSPGSASASASGPRNAPAPDRNGDGDGSAGPARGAGQEARIAQPPTRAAVTAVSAGAAVSAQPARAGQAVAQAPAARAERAPHPEPPPEPETEPEPEPEPEEAPAALLPYADFDAVIALIRARRDLRLLVNVERGLRVAECRPGRIRAALAPGTDAALLTELAGRLTAWTGARWSVSQAPDCDAPTIEERRAAEAAAMRAEAARNPLVAAALAAFPGAEIATVRPFAQEVDAPSDTIDDEGDVAPPDEDYDGAPPLDAYAGEDWSPFDPFEES
ncbi:DNA polymerase III subunit gamma/tau [Rubrimonas cliftonensis]|uniref:DNA polymerase III subunit gamma/tau n=1 Tax=Rubrimonas cliftonensis TaxID=89524 RepID=A0A1H3VU27_9RHOB|nr:DNA polymerase III subunit gamma/tau [Rubrimonas cliftonensis]SDZ78201.1 DNA polymerase-3 subunit gamma/tau [Rubrimonas cliftonensis]